MISTADFTQSWDLWVDYFKILFSSVIPVCKVIKDEKLMYNTYHFLCLLYSIVFIYIDSNQAYVHPLMNILFITVNISLFMLSIINIEFVSLLESNESLQLIIVFFVIFISFYLSILYYNHKSDRYQKMFDSGNDAQTFSDDLINNPESVAILRQQSVHDPQRATFFAEYLLFNTSDPFIYTESMRFLVLLQCMKEEVFEKIMKTNFNNFPILYRQIIYDSQMFVIAMDVSLGSVDSFLEELNSIYLKIELLLIQLSEEIQLKNKQRAIGLLSLYSNACNQFEGSSLNAFRHSPNSPQLAELMRQYYLNLRGDYIQSQVWSHRESITDSSTSVSFHSYSSFKFPFSVYGSRVWNANAFVRSKDSTTHNKLKSQEVIEKVKSKAIVKTIVVFTIFSLMTLFIVCYKYQIFDFSFVFSKESTIVFQSLSSTLISPILNSAKFALNIIINGTTRYSKLQVPSSSFISYTVQNLTSFITAVSESKENSNDIIAIWSNPQKTIFSTNVSLQYMLLQINGLTKLITNNLTMKEMSYFLMNFFHIYYSSYQPIDKLRLKSYAFIDKLRDKQFNYSVLFSLVCFFIEVIIVLLILFFMIHSTSDEKNKFWSIILEVDDKSIISFQETLRDDYINKSNQNQNSKKIGKVKSDDLEIINDETFSFPSTSTVIDENELKNSLKKKKPTNLIIISILFLLFLVCAYIFYIYLTLTVVNNSIRYNRSFDYMNIGVINVSNSATECAAILACGIDSENAKLFKNFLVKNSHYFDHSKIDLFDDEIVKIVETIDVVYNYVFSNLTKWFENGYKFDSYFESILDSALNISNPVLFKIEEWRLNRFEYYQNLKDSISFLFSIFVIFIYLIFSLYFLKRVVDYSSEFSFLKSLLIILPSPYLSTISNLISQFSPENNEDKSIESLKLRSRYILKQSVDSIIIVDSNKKIINLNEATEILTGMKKDELIGQEISKIISQEDSNENNSLNNETSEDKESVEFFRNLVFFNDQSVGISNSKKFNLHVIKSNGTLIPVSCTLINIQNHEDDDEKQNNSTASSVNSSSTSSMIKEQLSTQFTLSSSISYSSLTKEEATPAFAMVLCDRTAFTEQEYKLKTKKKEVEDLLDRVLPRVMAKKLSSGNQKLHSKIDKATIMFIGIVNILPWIRKHNPTEIMEQLDAICSIFDQNMANFPSLVKLKVINGTYMAAAGLFNETYVKPPPVEAVEFALLCAQSIANKNAITNKSISAASVSAPTKISAVSSATSLTAFNFPIPSPVPNLTMNISPGAVINKSSSGSSQIDDSPSAPSIYKSKPPLPPLPSLPPLPPLPPQQQQQQQQQHGSSASAPLNIKLIIGINTGPIIAGILGSDKPVFDVWGDAVNVSARLETSCPCNHIQMSKETMEYLKKGDFDIKMRKGVFLKGKGYTNTYTISFEDIMNGENFITLKDENDDE